MERLDIAYKWLEQVNEDIDTAECLYQSGRWLYIGFLCHQAIEKLIKAYWFAMREDEPICQSQVARMLNEKGSAYIIEQTKQFKQWILQKFSPEKRPSPSSENTNA